VYEIRDEQYKSDGLKHYIYLIYETLLPTADTNWLKDKIDAIQGTLNVMRGATGDAAAGGQDASIGPAPSTGT
jgi:hypothetical protein